MNYAVITIQGLTSATSKAVVSTATFIAPAHYYEWNARDKIWTKLIQTDPEPPIMPDGKFDGQIVEIRKPQPNHK
jgi:hypothetical protein